MSRSAKPPQAIGPGEAETARFPTLTVPVDLEAEREVIGCVIASARGLALARSLLTGVDFYLPDHRGIWAAAGQCRELTRPDIRIAEIAAVTGLAEGDLDQLSEDRSLYADDRHIYARRVLDAANRRRLMEALGQMYNHLGAGAQLVDLRGDVSRLLDLLVDRQMVTT